MKAARIESWTAPPVLRDIPEPQRKEGQSLIEVTAAAVNYLDVTIAGGEFEPCPRLPYTGGVEGAGRILESDTLPPGEHVLIRGGGVGLVKDGCWAERVVVSDRALMTVDRTLPAPLAASFLLPGSTGYVAVHDVAGLAGGERVIVRGGAGSVGSLAVQFALRAGAKVSALVGRSTDLPAVPTGADAVLVTDPVAMARLAETPADVLIDTLGGPDLPAALGLVRPGGHAILIGYALGERFTVDLPKWLRSDVDLRPVNMLRREPRIRELASVLADMLSRGEVTMRVDEQPLDEIATVMTRLTRGEVAGRAVVLPGPH